MKKLLFTIAFAITAFSSSAQSINLPTEYELGYYFGFHSHQLTAAAEFDMGIGIEGFAQTDIGHFGSTTDKFYVGLRYLWRGVETPKWEGTVSAGAWTTGLFYNFPIYPLHIGSRASLRYKINEKLTVGPQVFVTPVPNDSEVSIGIMYKLY